jgi:molybdate transport system ATP-binding protein
VLDVDITCRAGAFRLSARFEVPTRQTVAIFGHSGAGKTTLLHALAGVLRPDAGRIMLDDTCFFSSANQIDVAIEKRRIGYVFQEGRLFPHLSVAKNLDYGARRQRTLAGGTSVSRPELIELLGLSGLLARRTRDLSGGERQRVALARALLARPRLLLLDEPLAGLDAKRKGEILRYIEHLQKATSVAMVVVTHALEEVVRLSSHLVVLDAGTVRKSGETRAVLATPEMVSLFGQGEASTLISGTLLEPSHGHALARVAFDGGLLHVACGDCPIGSELRIRVRASDVSIATEEPQQTSISNILAARIVRIVAGSGADVQVLLQVGQTPLLASITQASLVRLKLVAGMPVFAMVKSIALIDSNLGDA